MKLDTLSLLGNTPQGCGSRADACVCQGTIPWPHLGLKAGVHYTHGLSMTSTSMSSKLCRLNAPSGWHHCVSACHPKPTCYAVLPSAMCCAVLCVRYLMVRRWMRNEPEVDVESIVGPVSDTVTLSHTAGAQSHSHTHWGGGGTRDETLAHPFYGHVREWHLETSSRQQQQQQASSPACSCTALDASSPL